MAKRKTTIYIDEEVLRAAKITAARSDRRESEVVEEALRDYLGLRLLQELWSEASMTEDEAMELAVSEGRIVRHKRQESLRKARSQS